MSSREKNNLYYSNNFTSMDERNNETQERFKRLQEK
jgi:hypothetical protein